MSKTAVKISKNSKIKVLFESQNNVWWWEIKFHGDRITGTNTYTTKRSAMRAFDRFLCLLLNLEKEKQNENT